jgi:hypothetical protein
VISVGIFNPLTKSGAILIQEHCDREDMGASPSVTVIHSWDVQKDIEALLAVFPNRFQVEAQGSDYSLLVEDQVTLVLVPCRSADGTYATLVLEEYVLNQVADRAIAYGIDVEEKQLLGSTMVKIRLPGKAILFAATADVWKDPAKRATAITQMLLLGIPTKSNGDGLTTGTVSLSGKTTKRDPIFPSKSSASKEMKRSVSMPVISDNATSAVNGFFPSLRVQISERGGCFENFPLNSLEPVQVETDLFVGKLLLIMRPINPKVDPFWNEKIFSKKKRRVIMQLQGKFKYKPEGVLYSGMEVSDPMNLGLIANG